MIIVSILQGGGEVHKQQLAAISQHLTKPGPRGSVSVTQVITHTAHEPGSEYEYAERMRSDATHISDLALIVSIVNALKSRIVEIQASPS